ncbi:hypothetical protein BNJ_00199 [Kaumoebavirus]|uniref:hypothetical protein n=1 Tax=Kaumoebavirus TaxID=1859492 RepID=UPI0009C3911F|nr:hypothetical protein BNJ_00199 [Kaumoebavirus]ARA72030.1 hypothetical protein BNJ_00199 [Kaumoebavirus]
MGAKNSRRQPEVRIVNTVHEVFTAIQTEDSDAEFIFDRDAKMKLVRDLAAKFPYMYFRFNVSNNDLEWGINVSRLDSVARLTYDKIAQTLSLDDDGENLIQGVKNYDHLFHKVVIMMMDDYRIRSIVLAQELERQTQVMEAKIAEALGPIQEKMDAIFTMLDALPGSQGYLEARTHFRRRRQSM